jgi:predicted DNA binding CopG/RHH family protein
MKSFRWNIEKNELLKFERGISFDSERPNMSQIDVYELEILNAFEAGQLKSIASKSELAKFKAAARASAIKDKRVNIRLSSVDLTDIQVRAMEEGVPYQTLITSVLHKYVNGKLVERSPKSSKSESTKT